jgi:hypothetical protein
MTEITEIDTEKYFVVKQEDLDDALDIVGTDEFETLIYEIEAVRKKKGKIVIYPSYLVLNMDDNFSIRYLFHEIVLMNEKTRFNQKWRDLKVHDIAVALVNAILKAKRD